MEARDGTCGTSAIVDIAVVEPLAVQPLAARVRPDTGFVIETSGGSGEVTCELVQDGSAASLVGCAWTAGPRTGTDHIDVVDGVTGERVTLVYDVEAGVDLRVWGRRIFLPAGQPYLPRFTAGTGVLDLTTPSGLAVVDGHLVGELEGTYTVAARDRFVPSLDTVFQVEVVVPRTVDVLRDGERAYWADVRGGDLDGDGFADAVVASVEPSVGAHYSGAVYVYAGGPEGLSDQPVRVFSVPRQYGYAGRGVDVGDVDGDGRLDVVVGAPGWDSERLFDRGRIDVYLGRPGSFPPETPDFSVEGEFGGDNLGHGVAVCDVDGDGIDDVAAGIPFGEDRSVSPLRSSEGGILVWRGSRNGLVQAPAWRVYGGTSGRALGRRVVGGDVDGDDRCDLVGASHPANLDGAGSDGVLWLFRSATVQAGGPADRLYTSDLADNSVELGRTLALGDVDGDGADDVVAGAWQANGPAGTAQGAAWVFREADAAGRSVWLTSEATAEIRPNNGFDYLGLGLDVSGGSVWVGAGSDEAPGGPGG
ncbi:MAG: FG-GAP-like repeat-containing protein, partial [Myxococcota bacterium]